jgi:hypothetical protein
MTHTRRETYVKGLGTVLYSEGPFDETLDELKSYNAEIISASQLAFARMQRGKDHSLSENGSYVKEGILYVPNAEIKRVLLRDSLVLENPKKATEAHRKNQEFFLGKDFNVNDFIESLPKDDRLFLCYTNSIPTDRFGEDGYTVWAFGESAKDYGLFLKDAGISSITFNSDDTDLIQSHRRPYANQLWFYGLGSDSNINGDYGSLNFNDRVRGVRRVNTQPTNISSLDDVLEYSRDFVPKNS